MTDEALWKIAEYAAQQGSGGVQESSDYHRAELRPMIQELLDEVASEIAAHWGHTDARPEGLAFALGYLHGRYKVKRIMGRCTCGAKDDDHSAQLHADGCGTAVSYG